MDEKKEVPSVAPQQPQPQKPKVNDRSIAKEIGKYAYEEVIKPKSIEVMRDLFTGVIGMFSDAATKSIDKALYPNGGAPDKRANRAPGQRTNYRVYSTSSYDRRPVLNRSSRDVECVWVATKEEAVSLIGKLQEEIDNYGKAKVSTLYENWKDENGNCYVVPTYADQRFGWTSKHHLGYSRDGSGYSLDLPRPENIENV